MQYREGFIEIQEGSSTVNGFNTDWVGNVFPGDLFIVSGDRVSYEIASVVSDTELTLTAPYPDEIDEATEYTIHQSRTANKNYPFPEKGDVETATIVKRAIKQIDDDDYLDNNDLAQNGGTVPEVDQDNNWAGSIDFQGLTFFEMSGVDGRVLRHIRSPVSDFPNVFGWRNETTHVYHVRASGSEGSENLQGIVWSQADNPILSWDFNQGILIGEPNGGFQGRRGALNAEELYEDGRRVVESDSNSDGEYVRWADGTQVCWSVQVIDSNTVWNFPVSFSERPGCFGMGNFTDTQELRVLMTTEVSTTSSTWSRFISFTSTRSGAGQTIGAIGRWF